MKTNLTVTILFTLFISLAAQAQEEEKEVEKKGFKKENLFTGGSISLAFYNNTFLIGASPVLGYNLTSWIDAGIVVNYNYTSYRDYNFVFNDKLRQTVYGGGVFARIFPVRFLFAQVQPEHNFIHLKLIRNVGGSESYNTSVNSLLVGGGYTTGRQKGDKSAFYYVAVLFDVSGNNASPYTDGYGRTIPIIRAGLQIPLGQGGGKRE